MSQAALPNVSSGGALLGRAAAVLGNVVAGCCWLFGAVPIDVAACLHGGVALLLLLPRAWGIYGVRAICWFWVLGAGAFLVGDAPSLLRSRGDWLEDMPIAVSLVVSLGTLAAVGDFGTACRFRIQHLLIGMAVIAVVIGAGVSTGESRGASTMLLHLVVLGLLLRCVAAFRKPGSIQSVGQARWLGAVSGALVIVPAFALFCLVFGAYVPFVGYAPGALAQGWKSGLFLALDSPVALMFLTFLTGGLTLILPATVGAFLGDAWWKQHAQPAESRAHPTDSDEKPSDRQPLKFPSRVLITALVLAALVIGVGCISVIVLLLD